MSPLKSIMPNSSAYSIIPYSLFHSEWKNYCKEYISNGSLILSKESWYHWFAIKRWVWHPSMLCVLFSVPVVFCCALIPQFLAPFQIVHFPVQQRAVNPCIDRAARGLKCDTMHVVDRVSPMFSRPFSRWQDAARHACRGSWAHQLHHVSHFIWWQTARYVSPCPNL